MPCTDSHDDEDNRLCKSRLDLATRLLCELCQNTPVAKMSSELRTWWEEHCKLDADRILTSKMTRRLPATGSRRSIVDGLNAELNRQAIVVTSAEPGEATLILDGRVLDSDWDRFARGHVPMGLVVERLDVFDLLEAYRELPGLRARVINWRRHGWLMLALVTIEAALFLWWVTQ